MNSLENYWNQSLQDLEDDLPPLVPEDDNKDGERDTQWVLVPPQWEYSGDYYPQQLIFVEADGYRKFTQSFTASVDGDVQHALNVAMGYRYDAEVQSKADYPLDHPHRFGTRYRKKFIRKRPAREHKSQKRHPKHVDVTAVTDTPHFQR